MEKITPAETPMRRVWIIVIGTMSVVAVMCFLWHKLGMNEIRAINSQSEKAVEESIEKVSQYLLQINSKASTTPILE